MACASLSPTMASSGWQASPIPAGSTPPSYLLLVARVVSSSRRVAKEEPASLTTLDRAASRRWDVPDAAGSNLPNVTFRPRQPTRPASDRLRRGRVLGAAAEQLPWDRFVRNPIVVLVPPTQSRIGPSAVYSAFIHSRPPNRLDPVRDIRYTRHQKARAYSARSPRSDLDSFEASVSIMTSAAATAEIRLHERRSRVRFPEAAPTLGVLACAAGAAAFRLRSLRSAIRTRSGVVRCANFRKHRSQIETYRRRRS